MKIYHSVSELIGNTPLLKLNKYRRENSLAARIFAKLESFNPGGSAKDRIAKKMIEDAEKQGLLKQGATIIEPTSGNTGIGLCMVAAAKGYKVIITMPETMSEERKKLMRVFGAELVLTDGAKGMQGAIDKANQLAEKIEGAFIPSQFTNKANYKAHFETTGPEIWKATYGEIDVFVAGVGTGGTITGVGKYLKSKNPNIKIVAVEPSESPVLSKGESGAHGIQGIGAGFVPEILDTEIYDEVITVSTQQAINESRELVKSEGLMVGISSGAALYAAKTIAADEKNRGKNIVVLFADTGERYLSTELFS